MVVVEVVDSVVVGKAVVVHGGGGGVGSGGSGCKKREEGVGGNVRGVKNAPLKNNSAEPGEETRRAGEEEEENDMQIKWARPETVARF